jgi:hypothetical protein
MSKIKSLQQALSASTGKAAAVAEREPATATKPAITRQPGRAGQVNISAWMDANFKASLRLVQARKGGSASLQDLMAEALNDLFTKYDVPTIRQD